jgi:hypothetical protein
MAEATVMSREIRTVTLTRGVESLTVVTEAEMPLREVSRWTGYNPEVLRRLDNDGKIAPAHRKGLARFWYAREVAEIARRRQDKAKRLAGHVRRLPRIIRARRKAIAGG